jgi:hypothetical protein
VRTPPTIRIERVDPGEIERRRARLAAWQPVYRERLNAPREALAALFEALESSSLSASTDHCKRVVRRVRGIDRRGLFPTPEVAFDRVLYGSLQRLAAGAGECHAGRYLVGYRLLREGEAGLAWLDRRLASRLRERIPLRGLER